MYSTVLLLLQWELWVKLKHDTNLKRGGVVSFGFTFTDLPEEENKTKTKQKQVAVKSSQLTPQPPYSQLSWDGRRSEKVTQTKRPIQHGLREAALGGCVDRYSSYGSNNSAKEFTRRTDQRCSRALKTTFNLKVAGET